MKPRVSGRDFQDGVECKSVDAVKQTVVLPEKDIPGAKLQLRNFEWHLSVELHLHTVVKKHVLCLLGLSLDNEKIFSSFFIILRTNVSLLS